MARWFGHLISRKWSQTCFPSEPQAAAKIPLVLQQNARSLGGSSGKLGKSLIVTQLALSLILLLGAGLFVRSCETFRKLLQRVRKKARISAPPGERVP